MTQRSEKSNPAKSGTRAELQRATKLFLWPGGNLLATERTVHNDPVFRRVFQPIPPTSSHRLPNFEESLLAFAASLRVLFCCRCDQFSQWDALCREACRPRLRANDLQTRTIQFECLWHRDRSNS